MTKPLVTVLLIISTLFAASVYSKAADSLEEKKALFEAKKILSDNENNVEIFTRVPPFNLTRHTQTPIELVDLYDKVWVVNFIYTECGDVCELRTKVMNGLQNALSQTPLSKDIRHVTITVDPDNDTADALENYVKNRNLDTSRWSFLTGDRSAVWELMKNGFKLPITDDTRDVQGPIPHSSDFIIVDWEGRIRGYYDVLKASGFAALKTDLIKVFDEQVSFPESLYDETFGDPRKDEQLKLAKTVEVFHDFSFNNEIDESGISFRHKIIDDVGTNYKSVHYDHGNAIAIADVDLDGFHDIYFTTLSGTNELWRNLGNGKFEDITDRAGLNIDDRIGMGASFADIDNDGDQDLYITNVRVGNILFENDGKGNFKDITETSGTGLKAHSSSAVFFDYNRDGLLDLFVTNVGKYTSDDILNTSLYGDFGQVTSKYQYYVGYDDAFAGHLKPERAEVSVLYENLGGNQFENVNEKLGLMNESWSGEATVIDGNNDGWPDLYILSMQGNDEYYENQKGKKFILKSRDVFQKTPWGSMGVKSFDYDNDGDMDLYVTDMHSDMANKIGFPKEKLKAKDIYPESFLQSQGNSIFGNAFYRNDGNGKYSEISDQIGLENYWPWGPGSGDLNADGFEDLFVASSMSYPFRYSVNSVFLNNKGKGFIDSEYMLGVEPRKNNVVSTPWYEIDCAGANKGHPGCAGGDAIGRTVVWGALGTRSSVIFDLDQDGDQDIVTLEFNHHPMVLINDLSEKNKINYLKVNLVGKTSNRNGIGAKVKVFSGTNIYTKVNDGKSGYLSQSVYPLYFGLGSNTKIDKIEVTWPSGITQRLSDDLSVNDLLDIKEP